MNNIFDNNGKLIINTLDENISLYEKSYESKFGVVAIDSSSAMGEDLAITAEMKKIADEGTQYAFLQNSPYEAINEGLDNLLFLRGMKRKVDEHSVVLVIFTGANDYVVNAGTQIKESTSGEIFQTIEQGIITNGTFSTFAVALNSGMIPCRSGNLSELVETVEGLTVNNPNDGILGYDRESDTQARKRLLQYDNALNINEILHMKLMNLPDVKAVKIVSNKESTTDENGIPARKTAIVVLGGNEKEIAKTIFTAPADYSTFGTTQTVVVSQITGNENLVNFSRPEVLFPTVTIDLVTDSSFNPEDAGVIKESVLSFFQDKFKLADDVIVDKLYIPAQQDSNNNNLFFKGLVSVNITLDGGTENLPVNYNQYAELLSSNIVLNIA